MFYLAGLLILALGLTLNTKAGLGVSAIISVSYSISLVTGYPFGNTTLGLYCLFIVGEMVLHTIRGRRYQRQPQEALVHAKKTDRKLVLVMDFLQLPLSIVFTRFLDIFGMLIPNFYEYGEPGMGRYAVQFLALFLAITCTGIGAAMSLNMRIIPNPGDGIVQAIADCARKEVGFTKNCVDVVNIMISISIGLIACGRLEGVGIGTLFAVIGVGRVISVFNRLFYKKMTAAAGI